MKTAILALAFILVGSAQTIHHVVTTGQSLSIGVNGVPVLSTTQPYSNLFYDTTTSAFIPLIEPCSAHCINREAPSSGIGNELTFLSSGQSYVAEVTKHGLTGVPYTTLAKSYSGCTALTPYNSSCHYNDLINYVNLSQLKATALSRAYCLCAVSVTHGETDQQNGTTAAQYEADLVEWQANIQTDGNVAAGATPGTVVPMFIDQMSTWQLFGSTTPATALGQWWAARDHPGTHFMVGPKYQFVYSSPDGIHLTGPGYRSLGELIGKAMKKVLIDGVRWVPLAPRRITLSANVISLVCWVPGGSLVFDTSTVSDKGTAKGFEFADDSGSTPTITGVSIIASDTIQITLSQTPAGANQRLRYAYTGTLNALGGSSGAPHGNVRDNDPTASQSGGTLYDWMITFDEPINFAWEPFASSLTSGNTVSSGRVSQ